MFLKSISDLIYNCAQSFSNASYLLERNCVGVFTRMRDETFHVVDARKVNMTLLLTLSYIIDDNNYDMIIPEEGIMIIYLFLFFNINPIIYFIFNIASCEIPKKPPKKLAMIRNVHNRRPNILDFLTTLYCEQVSRFCGLLSSLTG